jgi:hypothetical protein
MFRKIAQSIGPHLLLGKTARSMPSLSKVLNKRRIGPSHGCSIFSKSTMASDIGLNSCPHRICGAFPISTVRENTLPMASLIQRPCPNNAALESCSKLCRIAVYPCSEIAKELQRLLYVTRMDRGAMLFIQHRTDRFRSSTDGANDDVIRSKRYGEF